LPAPAAPIMLRLNHGPGLRVVGVNPMFSFHFRHPVRVSRQHFYFCKKKHMIWKLSQGDGNEKRTSD
jgi:hypothetical protein